MTAIVWPSGAPQRFDRNGFTEGFPEGRLRTAPETGPAKMRGRFSAAPKPYSGKMFCSNRQKNLIDEFWRITTGQGALPFWFPDHQIGGWPLHTAAGAELLTTGGSPLLISAWWLARFGEARPEAVPAARSWLVTIALEVMP